MEMNTVLFGLFSTILMGIGSLITLLLQTLLKERQKLSEEKFQFKFLRYKAICIQMYTLLNPKGGFLKISRIRPDLDSKESLEEELQAELYNAMLFASDRVLLALEAFNHHPNYLTYSKTLIAMRQDLWGKDSKLTRSLSFEFKRDSSNDIKVEA